MAVELSKYLEEQLRGLPLGHPDKTYLEGLLEATKGYNARVDGVFSVFNSVDQTVEAYKSQPRTPELVTRIFQTIWRERGKFVGATYDITPCPYTQKELTVLGQQGKRVGYLPFGLETQQNRKILGKMFPKMGSYSVKEGNLVTNNENPSGWFDYETGIDAPYLNTTEKQLTERVAGEGRKLLNLNQYIIASQDSNSLTGQYLDEKTLARLGSRNGGRVVHACFDRDGVLGVDWPPLGPDDHCRGLGGRSSGVK